jgi:hypothetical protein
LVVNGETANNLVVDGVIVVNVVEVAYNFAFVVKTERMPHITRHR